MIFGVCSRHVLNTSYLKNDFEAIEWKMQGELERIGRKKLLEKFRKSRGMTIALGERARPMSNEFRCGNSQLGKNLSGFGWDGKTGKVRRRNLEATQARRADAKSFHLYVVDRMTKLYRHSGE
jgi:hypothetical protein